MAKSMAELWHLRQVNTHVARFWKGGHRLRRVFHPPQCLRHLPGYSQAHADSAWPRGLARLIRDALRGEARFPSAIEVRPAITELERGFGKRA